MSLLVKRLTVSYEDFVKDAQTGDILLMHGRRMSSRLIELLEHSPWSHATMIVRGSDIGVKVHNDPLLIWESNVDTHIDDVILNRPKNNGPMLVRLEDRIRANFERGLNSMFAVRHLHATRSDAMFEGLKQAIKDVHSRPFPHPPLVEFLNAFTGRILDKPSGDSSFFCSQLVAFTLKKMGLLSTDHPDNAFIPLDFSEAMDISLRQRTWLGPEMQLDTDTIIAALSKKKKLKFGPAIAQADLDRELEQEIDMIRNALIKAYPSAEGVAGRKPAAKKNGPEKAEKMT